mmetsp:Transcript_26107/g.74957  ORF Transcript_26107/g.74957 Transcript_26107/m.74957 type:complete len:195 (-) Transcript_26107:1021-1605(-)
MPWHCIGNGWLLGKKLSYKTDKTLPVASKRKVRGVQMTTIVEASRGEATRAALIRSGQLGTKGGGYLTQSLTPHLSVAALSPSPLSPSPSPSCPPCLTAFPLRAMACALRGAGFFHGTGTAAVTESDSVRSPLAGLLTPSTTSAGRGGASTVTSGTAAGWSDIARSLSSSLTSLTLTGALSVFVWRLRGGDPCG